MYQCCFVRLMNAMEASIFTSVRALYLSQESANGGEKGIPAKGFLSLHFRFMVENFIETLLKMLSLVPISWEVRISLLLVRGVDGGSEMHCQKISKMN